MTTETEPRTQSGKAVVEWARLNHGESLSDHTSGWLIAMVYRIEREAERKYLGMVKERDDQIYRKRETRRILTERATPSSKETEPVG